MKTMTHTLTKEEVEHINDLLASRSGSERDFLYTMAYLSDDNSFRMDTDVAVVDGKTMLEIILFEGDEGHELGSIFKKTSTILGTHTVEDEGVSYSLVLKEGE